MGELEDGLELLLGLDVEAPDDTGAVVPASKMKYDAVAKVLPSLAKATQLMGSLAALVGLVTTSPLCAL